MRRSHCLLDPPLKPLQLVKCMSSYCAALCPCTPHCAPLLPLVSRTTLQLFSDIPQCDELLLLATGTAMAEYGRATDVIELVDRVSRSNREQANSLCASSYAPMITR